MSEGRPKNKTKKNPVKKVQRSPGPETNPVETSEPTHAEGGTGGRSASAGLPLESGQGGMKSTGGRRFLRLQVQGALYLRNRRWELVDLKAPLGRSQGLSLQTA